MANQKITDMPVATSVADADIATIVQGGANKQVTALLLLKTPQDAAAAAQATADAAQTTANDALPKAGGPVTGDIDMGTDAQFVGNAPDGPTNPSFTYGGQQALTGMYAVSAGITGFSGAGVEAARISPAGTSAPDATTIMTREKFDFRGDDQYEPVIEEFDTGWISYTNNAATSVAHGLGAAPTRLEFLFRLKVAFVGWSIGDIVNVHQVVANQAYTVGADATNVIIAAEAASGQIVQKTAAGSPNVVSATQLEVRIRARL